MKTHYDLEKALKNPQTPQDVCIFLDREDPALLENLGSLVNLKKLSILDKETLVDFPKAIFELTQLESLRIRATNFTSLPEALGQLKNLVELEIENVPLESLPESIGTLSQLKYLKTRRTKLKCLPDSLTKLRQLERIEFWSSELETLPEEMGEWKQLKWLQISSPFFKKLPDGIGQLSQLHCLHIREGQLKELPQTVSNLVALKHLDCKGNQLSRLPKGFSNLKVLKSIDMEGNRFKEFPLELCECRKLEILEFNDNELTDLPEALGQLKEIVRMDFKDNHFSSLPYILLDWGDTFALKHRWGFSIEPELYYNTKLFDLLKKKAFKDLTREEKVAYFKIYSNNKAEIETVDVLALRKALNAKVPAIADNALGYLTKNSEQTLREGAEILIWGKISKEKVALQDQMEACALKSVTKLQESTTHVLVSSRGNKKLERLPESVHWNWIRESQLMAYMDQVQPSFLVEASSTNESVDQVRDLIMTLNEENMALALELITGGGLPPELLTEVFIVYKLSSDATLRKKAQKLLKQKADIALQQVLRRRTNIRQNKSYYFEEDYQALNVKLKSYTDTTAIDYGKLAFAVAICSRFGYAYALDTAPLVYAKRLVEEVLIQNGDTFDLSYNERFLKFPMAILEFPQLKTIKMDIVRGSWETGKWKANDNFLIPEEIVKLKNLEELEIRGVSMNSLPIAAICQLKQLKRLVLSISRTIDTSPIKKALPHCEMDFR